MQANFCITHQVFSLEDKSLTRGLMSSARYLSALLHGMSALPDFRCENYANQRIVALWRLSVSFRRHFVHMMSASHLHRHYWGWADTGINRGNN